MLKIGTKIRIINMDSAFHFDVGRIIEVATPENFIRPYDYTVRIVIDDFVYETGFYSWELDVLED